MIRIRKTIVIIVATAFLWTGAFPAFTAGDAAVFAAGAENSGTAAASVTGVLDDDESEEGIGPELTEEEVKDAIQEDTTGTEGEGGDGTGNDSGTTTDPENPGTTTDPENPGTTTDPEDPGTTTDPQEPAETEDLSDVSLKYEGKATGIQSWNLDYIDVFEAWNLIQKMKYQGRKKGNFKTVKVASIDTGANYTHPDLAPNMDAEHSVRIVKGKITKYNTGALFSNHGTASASIICAAHNGFGVDGVASGIKNNLVSLMAIDVYGTGRTVALPRTADVIKAIDYAIANDAKIIQICMGHAPKTKDLSGAYFNDKLLEAKIAEVTKKGIIVVSSAGNHKTTALWYPADYKNVISVINLKKKYPDAWGSSVKHHASNYGKNKTLAAPGAGTYAANRKNRYRMIGGTSAASAHVVGVLALMCYIDPTLDYAKARSILTSTADDLYTKGKDSLTSVGKVNAYNAVAKTAKNAGYSLKGSAAKLPKSIKAVKLKAKAAEGAVVLTWSKQVRRHTYYIYRKTGSGKYKFIAKTTSTTYTDKKASTKKKSAYKVRVQGTTKDGKKVWSGYSNKVKAKAKKVKKAKKTTTNKKATKKKSK